MSEKSISILGCGWLGYPLAKSFVQADWKVKGSTTTESKLSELNKEGILPFLIDISNISSANNIIDFLNSEILILNVPPSKNQGTLSLYNDLLPEIEKSSINKIIFISSTSAYSDHSGITTENNAAPDLNSPNKTLVYEYQFSNLSKIQTTIVRFAGLIGGSRHPGNFFKSGKPITNPNAPVNLIHLDDCINIISQIIEKDCWNEIINACADQHPSKKEFYTKASLALKLAAPKFSDNMGSSSQKIISNEKSKLILDYQYLHPDPMILLDNMNF